MPVRLFSLCVARLGSQAARQVARQLGRAPALRIGPSDSQGQGLQAQHRKEDKDPSGNKGCNLQLSLKELDAANSVQGGNTNQDPSAEGQNSTKDKHT